MFRSLFKKGRSSNEERIQASGKGQVAAAQEFRDFIGVCIKKDKTMLINVEAEGVIAGYYTASAKNDPAAHWLYNFACAWVIVLQTGEIEALSGQKDHGFPDPGSKR
jgi:hypothetical protein